MPAPSSVASCTSTAAPRLPTTSPSGTSPRWVLDVCSPAAFRSSAGPSSGRARSWRRACASAPTASSGPAPWSCVTSRTTSSWPVTPRAQSARNTRLRRHWGMSVFDVSQGKVAPFASEDSIAALHRNQTTFGALVDACVAATGAGAFANAAMLAELAAHVAWRCHPGQFASRAMEQALETAGQRFVVEAGRSASRGTYGTGRRISSVLHVLSSVYSDGGHTKFVPAMDRARHRPAPTSRCAKRVKCPTNCSPRCGPPGLTRRSHPSGPAWPQARVLSNLAAKHDVVVLHTPPGRSVPNPRARASQLAPTHNLRQPRRPQFLTPARRRRRGRLVAPGAPISV